MFYYIGLSQLWPAALAFWRLSPDRVGPVRNRAAPSVRYALVRSRSSARSVRRTGRCARLSAADGSSTASPPRRPRPLCGSARCTWPSLRGALHVCRRRPLHAASVRSGVTSAVSPSHGWLPNVPHHRSPSRFASRRPQGLSHRAPSPQFAVLHSGHCRGTETAIQRGCLLQGSAYNSLLTGG